MASLRCLCEISGNTLVFYVAAVNCNGNRVRAAISTDLSVILMIFSLTEICKDIIAVK